ncbi:hypothetical protein [Celeribacter baekdonensis]|uniref:hypothetical protein n=1 Tax=Celeribacter baekdonensis TaxID=875171 RepID=UPI0030D9ADD7
MQYISKFEKRKFGDRAYKKWRKKLRRRDKDGKIKVLEIKIIPPEIFSFSRGYDDTVSCLKKLKDKALSPPPRRTRVNVHIDLAPIKSISTAAALVLAAEIDRWRRHKKVKLRPRNVEDWDPSTLRMLTGLGFFDLLGVDESMYPALEDLPDELAILPLVSCNTLDRERISMIEEHLRMIAAAFDQEPSIYTALTEAAYNSINHGYPDDHEFVYRPIKNTWWATGSWSPDQQNVKLIVYDQGVGIPTTLPAWDHWETLRGWMSNKFDKLATALKQDASMIEAALEVSRTSLTSGHGQGLKDVVSPIDVLGKGQVRILSGKGEVRYSSDGSIYKTERSQHIGGTLIEWTIPVL